MSATSDRSGPDISGVLMLAMARVTTRALIDLTLPSSSYNLTSSKPWRRLFPLRTWYCTGYTSVDFRNGRQNARKPYEMRQRIARVTVPLAALESHNT